MGGAADNFLELMLFIGFKYKLNMTTQLDHGNLLTQHNITSLALEATLGCTALENYQQRGSKLTVSLVSHKSHNNCVQNPKSKL